MKHLRQYIRQILLQEAIDPIKWLETKASTEYDEAKFRVLWKKELLLTLNPGTKAIMKDIRIEGKAGERIAKAWAKVGHEKFSKAAIELKGKQKQHFIHIVNGIGMAMKWADPDKLSRQIDDLFDPESELYKKSNQGFGEKAQALWDKYFG